MKNLRYRLGRLRATITDPRNRSAWWAGLHHRRHIHQDTSYTALDRYPVLFRRAQTLLGEDAAGPLLSFGCSTGEEVMTLRRYFPAARIYGTDINAGCLAKARALGLDDAIVFLPSRPALLADHGPYTAIFCLAVLQRRPDEVLRFGMDDLSRHYPFALFEAEIDRLVDWLAPGGLLVVENAQYRVEDTRAARLLDRLSDDDVPPAQVPYARFGRDGRRLASATPAGRLFRRR